MGVSFTYLCIVQVSASSTISDPSIWSYLRSSVSTALITDDHQTSGISGIINFNEDNPEWKPFFRIVNPICIYDLVAVLSMAIVANK